VRIGSATPLIEASPAHLTSPGVMAARFPILAFVNGIATVHRPAHARWGISRSNSHVLRASAPGFRDLNLAAILWRGYNFIVYHDCGHRLSPVSCEHGGFRFLLFCACSSQCCHLCSSPRTLDQLSVRHCYSCLVGYMALSIAVLRNTGSAARSPPSAFASSQLGVIPPG